MLLIRTVFAFPWALIASTGRLLRRAPLRSSAAAIVVVVLLVARSVPHFQQSAVCDATTTPVYYSSRFGEHVHVTLPDQSGAELDTGTRIAVTMCGTARIVTLEAGQALITIAPDPSR